MGGLEQMPAGRFELGHIVATPDALATLEESSGQPGDFLCRHASGDWGDDLSEEDRRENELSVAHGFRILSVYTLRNGTAIWIITEADRSSTTILLPHEY
jgi:hypothetical protein